MKAQANRTVVLVNGRYLFNGSMPAHRARSFLQSLLPARTHLSREERGGN